MGTTGRSFQARLLGPQDTYRWAIRIVLVVRRALPPAFASTAPAVAGSTAVRSWNTQALGRTG